MHSEIRTFHNPDGTYVRAQCVRLPDWEGLDFLFPAPSPRAFEGFVRIYRDFMVPHAPDAFGQLKVFCLPEEGLPAPGAAGLRQALSEAADVRLVSGNRPEERLLPVRRLSGYLSESAPEAEMACNAGFFIMDCFDCATPYDAVGTPIGLMVKDGEVLSPPLYDREALLVYGDGTVRVERPSLSQLTIRIGQEMYRAGQNARLFTRPEGEVTPEGEGTDLVIVGRQVCDVRPAGGTPVPASGFVLRVARTTAAWKDPVCYEGMENVRFGIQAGSSTVIGGEPVTAFRSAFWDIRHPATPSFPPSLYPLNYARDRAARLALGAGEDGRPMLVWAEGAGKNGIGGTDQSAGASLLEMAHICQAFGMREGINLDGGGSAQILQKGNRALRLPDRMPDGTDLERAVPVGIVYDVSR